MTDSRSNLKSNLLFTLNGKWRSSNDFPDSSLTLTEVEDTIEPEDCEQYLNPKIFISNTSRLRSPWKYEKKNSSSISSSQTSIFSITKMTPKIKKRRATLGFSRKKSVFNKNSGTKSLNTSTKPNTPRARWATTAKKRASKYSWTGKFNHRSKRTFFANSNSVEISIRPESGFCSITRTPSPVDENFFYGNDPDTMAKVFHLNSVQGNQENNIEDLNFNDFEQYDKAGSFSEIENENNGQFKNGGFGVENNLRNRFEKKRRSQRILINDFEDNENFINHNDLFTNIHDDDDIHFSPKNCTNPYVPRNNYSNVEQKGFCQRMLEFFTTFIVNVFIFSILPIIYIAFFMYMHSEDNN